MQRIVKAVIKSKGGFFGRKENLIIIMVFLYFYYIKLTNNIFYIENV